MAEVKPDPARPGEPAPRVVPLASARPQPSHQEPDSGVSQRVFAIALGLLVIASAGLIIQTQRVANKTARIAALQGQVEGLSVQLAAANTKIASYDKQLSLIRSTVTAISDQMAALSDLVGNDPATPTAVPAPVALPERPPEP
jgi:hypothetical protein